MKLGLSHQWPQKLTDGQLKYLRALGVERIEARMNSNDYTLDALIRLRGVVEESGLELHEVMLDDVYSSPDICLGLAGREATLELLKRFIRDLGRAGIRYTTYAWSTLGAYQTGQPKTRECPTRGFELSKALALPNAYDRIYNDAHMWDTYAHFLREILPIAEDADVRLQLHPNDPPVSHMGVARIFRSTAAYQRAMEMSYHSPYNGILFCVGTFAEMPGEDGKGEDVMAAIREFGRRGLIHQVHFRNIDRPMPDFSETFPDDGYLDMPAVVRALAEVGFNGMLVPDHVPDTSELEGGPKLGEAFTLGYIRGLMQSAQPQVAETGQ